METDLLPVALLGLLSISLLVYGFLNRAERASGYWIWAWGLLAFNGAVIPLGADDLARAIAAVVPVLMLLGAMPRRTRLSPAVVPRQAISPDQVRSSTATGSRS